MWENPLLLTGGKFKEIAYSFSQMGAPRSTGCTPNFVSLNFVSLAGRGARDGCGCHHGVRGCAVDFHSSSCKIFLAWGERRAVRCPLPRCQTGRVEPTNTVRALMTGLH